MSETIKTAGHVALLAPVPLEHLLDGETTAKTKGKVAFGSQKWELFRQLDALRKGMPVDVYIYASHANGQWDYDVSWHARYIQHVESKMGTHPDGMEYRPLSTAKYPSDSQWAVFWEVEDLKRLPREQRMVLAELTGFGKKKSYGHAFAPELSDTSESSSTRVISPPITIP
jgi:hypothetical protein